MTAVDAARTRPAWITEPTPGQPSKFFTALQDRDRAIRELDQLRQQRDEARDANAQLASLLQAAYSDIADLRAELDGRATR